MTLSGLKILPQIGSYHFLKGGSKKKENQVRECGDWSKKRNRDRKMEGIGPKPLPIYALRFTNR